MNHQDDLETEYKAASNEQPSELSDQIILQAAKDAIEKQPEDNVIKGKFASRRWHTPVSLAAAAVITVSVVSTLKPWSVSVPVSEPPPVMTQSEELVMDSAVSHFEDEEVVSKQKADVRYSKKRTVAKNEILERKMQSSMERVAPTAAREQDSFGALVSEKIEADSILSVGSSAIDNTQLSHQDKVAQAPVDKSTKQASNQAKLAATILYPEPKLLPDFTLVDHNNQPFSNNQLIGKWSVIFFGYTFCPDICPTTLAVLSRIAKNLQPETLQKIQFIFISIDPKRDSPGRLSEYMPFYHSDFIGVTGSNKQLLTLSRSLGAMYMKATAKKDSTTDYMMSHTGSLFIVDPQGRRGAIIPKTTGIFDVKAITQDLETIIKK